LGKLTAGLVQAAALAILQTVELPRSASVAGFGITLAPKIQRVLGGVSRLSVCLLEPQEVKLADASEGERGRHAQPPPSLNRRDGPAFPGPVTPF
jgi:hypothetical protein